MILTNCAACAAPLAHDAPRCIRCKLRYCNKTCQHDHWRRGHKQMCKKIHRGGNAEQYHADKKYKEAVAVAVEACAADTKGQKCYICLEAVHPRTGEGLVRGCACGDRDGVSSPELGVAHVSCFGRLKINGEEREETLRAANNYADSLIYLKRFEEAKALFSKVIPVARRVLGEGDRIVLKMRRGYAMALYMADGATLDDLREGLETIEDAERITRRVFGSAHPLTEGLGYNLREARAALRAREAPGAA
jgi:hypothetical protein